MAANAQLRALLLHSLPEKEMEALGGRILLEEGFAEQLEEAEIDLLDDYAHQRLTSEERGAVERHLLKTLRNRERLLTAHAIRRLRK
jgi:hypothetical protein